MARHPLACRKNKTLGAIFRQNSTLALLEQNHAVAAALQQAADGGTVDLAAALNRLAMDAEAATAAGEGADWFRQTAGGLTGRLCQVSWLASRVDS
jgi:hypothetical protein